MRGSARPPSDPCYCKGCLEKQQTIDRLVEEVKRDIPVWKRQVFPDGTHEWSNSA